MEQHAEECMERRVGLRGRTDFAVTASNGFFLRQMRAIELSGTGIVLDSGKAIDPHAVPLYMHLQIRLPERRRPITALARPVWSYGQQQALRFIKISDVDRLTLAEHLDVVHRRGVQLN
jgi:hypothetical protein